MKTKLWGVIGVLALSVLLMGAWSEQKTKFTNLNVTENFSVGNGTPGTATGDEDAYVEGDLEVDGTFTLAGATAVSGDLTLQNGEKIQNSTDAVLAFIYDDDAVEQGDFRIKSSNQGTAANDTLQASFWAYDDSAAPVEQEYAQLTMTMTDPTSNSEDSLLTFAVATAGTLAGEAILSGAALYPATDNGLNLGIASTNDFGDGNFQGTVTATGLVHNGFTLVKGTGEVSLGANSKTLTVSGTDSDDIAIATLNEVNGTSCTISSCAPGTNQIVLTLDTVTATTTTFSYMVWQN